ncbi:MAG: carbohydrate-binding family 9-like protein, partial [bacterium]
MTLASRFVLSLLVAAAAAHGAARAPSGPYEPDAFTSLLLHFDEGRGERAADAGEFAIRCTLRGARWAEGRFGGGLDCQGGAAAVALHPALTPEHEVTVEAWVRVEKGSEDIQRIAYRSGVYGLYLGRRGTRLTFYTSTGGQWESVHAEVPLGRWVHLAGVYDGREMRVYVDGELRDRREKTGALAASRAPFEIGGEAAAGRRYLQGRIDEVRVSHVARTAFDPSKRLTFEPTAAVREVPPPKDPLKLVVPTLVIGQAATAPALNGRLDEATWEAAARLSLDDTRAAARPSQPTEARVAWDAEHLYVAARCAEARMSRIVAGVERHDGPVWQDDCIELFLKPNPKARTYYHIGVNTLGTVYDGRNRPSDKGWESKARVAVSKGQRAWFIEMAFPFAAFAEAPRAGERWRFNIGREEKPSRENSSWAPVGGRFHSPGKFGWLEFAAKPVPPETAATTVQGLVLDAQGRRAQRVAVGTAVGTRYSNALGLFRVEGLPRGEATFVVSSPRYHPVAVEAELTKPFERIQLPPLREVDPNALAIEVPPSDRGYRVYAVEPLDDLDPARLPPKNQEGAAARAFATPGEYEPLGAAIFSAKALEGVEVTVGTLQGPDGATIGGEALDLRLVKRYLRRRRYNSPAEDAVFSSRYLLPAEPFDMAPHTFRRVHLIVQAPDEAPAGVYRGTLRIAPEDAPAAELPLQLEVLDIALGPPSKHYAAYYYGRHPGRSDAEAEAIIRRELADLRAHGADRLLWRPRIQYSKDGERIAVDYADVRRHIVLLREYGFQPPYIVWTGLRQLARLVGSETSERFRREGEQALRGLVELAEREGWGEVAVTHMDEVFGRNRFDRYVRLTKVVRRVPD